MKKEQKRNIILVLIGLFLFVVGGLISSIISRIVGGFLIGFYGTTIILNRQ